MKVGEVKFEVKYYVRPDSEDPCWAGVTTMIKTKEEDGWKIPVLLRSEKEFIRNRLGAYWGHANAGYRQEEETLYAPSWNELKRKIEKRVEGHIEFLRKVTKENLRLLKEKPEDQTIVVNLSPEEVVVRKIMNSGEEE